MKRRQAKTQGEEMQKEYNFSGGIRGKYAKRFSQGSNVVVLDPDVTTVFADSESVNRALRALSEVIKQQKKRALA